MGNEKIKEKLHKEIEDTKNSFSKLLDSISADDSRRKSKNSGWTNGEILFHMLFGYLILNTLIPVVLFFGKLPKNYSRVFANILNFLTPFFNWINGLGARGGAKVFYGEGLKIQSERIFNSLLRKVDSFKESEWKYGMYFPKKWDFLFDEYMTLENLFHYPHKHFKFHLKQLK